MNESDEETCIAFRISSRNKCNNCASWEDRRLYHPGKKRDSLCRKPWLLRDDADIDNIQQRTIRKICGSWDDMIRAGVFKNSDIPSSVRIAASTISHKFVTTSAKSEEEEAETNPILRSRRSRRSGATRKNEPPTRYTPKDRKQKVPKVGQTNSNIHNNNAFSSPPFEKKGLASFNNLVNNLEGRFHSTLNLLENACGNLNNVADESNMMANNTNTTPSRYHNLVSVDTIQNLNVVVPPPTSIMNPFDQKEKEFLNESNKLLKSKLNEVKKSHRLEKKKLDNEIGNLKRERFLLKKQVSNLDNRLRTIKHNELNCHDRLINKSYYTVLQQFKDDVTKLMKQVKSERYVGKSNLGKRLLGEVLATHPSISFVNAAEIIMISRAQLLAEADWVDGHKLSFSDIGLSSPSDKYLRGILDDTTSDVLFLMFFKIFYEDKVGQTVPSLYLSCDKATNGGFIKILSWYSPTSNKVEQNIFDVDKTYGDSIECAKAM